jgi:hypothetical protein
MRSAFRFLASLSVATLALTACSDDSEPLGQIQPVGYVRVVHASPDAPNVDVLVDDAVALTNVSYRNASAYLTVPPGERRLRVRAAGTTTTVIDATANIADRAAITVLATGRVATIAPLVTVDTLTDPAAGNVKIRVIHAAPAAGNVDVYATDGAADINTATPVLTNVPFRGVSGFLEVPAGVYRLRVTPAGTKTVAIDATVVLTAGQLRTVVATDAPGGGAPLGAIVLNDKN